MPQDYESKILLFDNTSPMTSKQHIDKMNDCFYLQEIDDDSVKLRMFAQSLWGEVRKWFKGLISNIIHDLPTFH